MRIKLGILLTVFFTTFFSGCFCYSQQNTKETFFFDGLVYGYKHETSNKLLQKDKQTILEGVLQSVQVNIIEDGSTVSGTITNKKGEFEIKISTGKVYRLEFTKTNYIKSILIIDLRSIPPEMTTTGIYFTGAEIILNSFKSKDTAQSNLPFGKIFYNTKTKNFDFEAGKNSSKKGLFSKKEESNNAAYLMRRAVNKNKDNLKRAPEKIKKTTETKSSTAKEEEPLNTNTTVPGSEFKLKPVSGINTYNDSSISSREAEIAEAMEQLALDKANAVTPEDSLRVAEKEGMLRSAMVELENAKGMIEMQKNEISVQRRLLFLVIFCLVLVSAFGFMLFRHNREKRRTHLILKENARKIRESINYASRIQQSVLLEEEEVKKLIPDSFIFFNPRDVVSGDFYWLSEQNGKVVIAVVDCTGHGVPGAFMSLIGNTLLNQIVNEKQITKPSEILKEMHAGVLKALRQDTQGNSQDGMDMSVCVIDRSQKTLTYAGAMNPIYLVKGNEVESIKPDMLAIGGAGSEKQKGSTEFMDHLIPIEKGMSVYMFTDGYMDQFGGPEGKKFNTKKFKELLLEMRTMNVSDQKNAIKETINKWRGDQKQIDDMLVIGITF